MPLLLATPIRPSFSNNSTTPPPPPNSFPSPPDSSTAPSLSIVTSSAPSPLLLLQPASPATTQPTSGLASRRSKNMKMLSLVVPTNPLSSALHSPSTPTTNDPFAETRSLPPSPISLTAYVGVEGAEEEDRTIGRLMMKQQVEEMREQMKGGRGMKRRTSIPRLHLGSSATSSYLNRNTATTSEEGSGSAVRLIRRDNLERLPAAYTSPNSHSYFPPSSSSSPPFDTGALPEEPEEEFPYEHGPREILPGIWLGSELNARDPKVLRKFGIGWILNVAKEVVCPWIGEVEKVESETNSRGNAARGSGSGTSLRPLFIRPTTSTPNLRSAFKSSFSSAPSPILEDPSSPLSPSTVPLDPLQRLRPPTTPLKSKSTSTTVTPLPSPPLTASKSINFPQNRTTGRPELEYLWLKWGHDESDLVEAGKFGTAFDFIDRAKAAGGNVLIQCQCGVSRSATVMIGYCMREASRALNEGQEVAEGLGEVTGMHSAYSFVKEKSVWVGPNLNLVFQLVAYERTLRGVAPTTEAEYDEDYPHQTEEEGSATSPDDADDGTTFSVDSVSTRTTASREEISGEDEMECEAHPAPEGDAMMESEGEEGRAPPLMVDTKFLPRPLSTASDLSFTSSSSATDIITPTITTLANLTTATTTTTTTKAKHSRTQSLFPNFGLKEYARSSVPHFSAPLPSTSSSSLYSHDGESEAGGGGEKKKEENHFFPRGSFVLPRSSSYGPMTTLSSLHPPALSSSSSFRLGLGKKLFGTESAEERRINHRRVFSLDVGGKGGFGLFAPSKEKERAKGVEL